MNNTTRVAKAFLLLAFLCFFLSGQTETSYARDQNPEDDLSVKSYSWKSHGVGRLAVLREITIANSGKTDYGNVEIRVDLLTRSGKFAGSFRKRIQGEVAAGSEATFHDVELGLMSLDLEDSEAMVTDAEASQSDPRGNARDAILVKNWEFEGARFANEGFITEITLENTGRSHFKNIRLLVTERGTEGSAGRDHISSVVIRNVIRAGEEKTFTGVNVGFSSPDARERSVSVAGADAISAKELNYILAGGGSLGQAIKDKLASVRRPEKTPEKTKEQKTLISDDPDSSSETDRARNDDGAREKKTESPDAEETETVRSVLKDAADGVALENQDGQTTSPGNPAQAEVEVVAEEPPQPLPRHDIAIREFKWGSGIPGSMGTLARLVVENISEFTYSEIELEIEFFTPQNAPFGSNRFKLKEVLAPGKVLELENIQVGFINKLPDPNNIKLRVVKAETM